MKKFVNWGGGGSKPYKIRKSKYIILIFLMILGFSSVYFSTSYGLFKKKQYLTRIDFVTGSLNYKIENENLNNNKIIVNSGAKQKLTLKITSLNPIDSKYELYYLIDGKKTTNDNVIVGYTSETKDSVTGLISTDEEKNITVTITNNSSKNVEITFGVQGGLKNNELVLNDGLSVNKLITNDDVMLAYTYIGSNTSPTKFPSKQDGYYVTDYTCKGGTAYWDNSEWTMKVESTSSDTISCSAKIKELYKDNSGANSPVIKDSLTPVKISSTGVVTKADLTEEWYNYDNNVWANAIIPKNKTKTYSNGETIPEDDIESYFVWIPKYDYQIFNMGTYTALGTKTDATQVINVRFSNNNTSDNDTECNYPVVNKQATEGVTTPCAIGKWMTHPAFTTLGTTGFWVGKFDTGYNGATSTATAQSDSEDPTKIIIKPNVYSWRSITAGKIFNVSYNYNRYLDSHAMKNTEWGAMAYLSASKYGYKDTISATPRKTAIINNNSNYVTGYASTEEPTKGYNGSSIAGNRQEAKTPGTDGTYTKNYLNTYSQLASTTGNYSGVYDTSGGAWNYVMGYTTKASTEGGSSTITALYPGFFSNSAYYKYWDLYTSTANTNWNKRILGDATGEMGPFQSTTDPDNNSRYKSSWSNDYCDFASSSSPWFLRGGIFTVGVEAGSFAFDDASGTVGTSVSFRVVLAP